MDLPPTLRMKMKFFITNYYEVCIYTFYKFWESFMQKILLINKGKLKLYLRFRSPNTVILQR